MILVRNVFQLKFGKAKEAVSLWKEGVTINERLGYGKGQTRILTDLVGNYYTLVLEMTFESLADYEKAGRSLITDTNWQNWYQKVVPLIESGHREVFSIVQ